MEPAFEFESPEEQLEFERDRLEIESTRAKLEQEIRASKTRDKLTYAVGLFFIVMPLLIHASKVLAAWQGKEAPAGGLIYDITFCTGMLSILCLQFPSVIPLLKEFMEWSAELYKSKGDRK